MTDVGQQASLLLAPAGTEPDGAENARLPGVPCWWGCCVRGPVASTPWGGSSLRSVFWRLLSDGEPGVIVTSPRNRRLCLSPDKSRDPDFAASETLCPLSVKMTVGSNFAQRAVVSAHPIELLEQAGAGLAELARGMRVIMAGPRRERLYQSLSSANLFYNRLNILPIPRQPLR
jgi:hypothetical protein